MKKIAITIVSALIAAILLSCAGSPAWEGQQINKTAAEAEQNNDNLMNVQIGQTKQELIQLMGQPHPKVIRMRFLPW